MRIENVDVSFIGDDHGPNYDDKYLRYENVDTYFFKNNSTGEIYRWKVRGRKEYYFNVEDKYKISANLGEKNEHGIRITYPKIEKLAKRKDGNFIWVNVN